MKRLAILVGTVLGSAILGIFACLVVVMLPVAVFRVVDYLRWYEMLCLAVEGVIMLTMFSIFVHVLGGFIGQAWDAYKVGE